MPISPGGTPYDDEDLDALFKAVGFVVVNWGQAEQTLEMIVAMLYQQLGGKRLVKRIPVPLSAKVAFMEKCLNQLPALSQLKTQSQELAQTFTRVGKKRHDLIHGAIASLTMENGGFKFSKLDVRGEVHVLRTFHFEAATFPAFTQELIDLGSSALALGSALRSICEGSTAKHGL